MVFLGREGGSYHNIYVFYYDNLFSTTLRAVFIPGRKRQS